MTFEGVHWSALEPLVRPKPSAHFVVAHAEEGYTANVPISFLRDPLSLLATHADGEPLTPEHGGPLRLVIPRKYFWKSAKWLRGIELTPNDRPGLLGALRLPQRRRPVRRRSATASSARNHGSHGDSPERGTRREAATTKTWVPNPPQFFPLEWPSQRPLFFLVAGSHSNPLAAVHTSAGDRRAIHSPVGETGSSVHGKRKGGAPGDTDLPGATTRAGDAGPRRWIREGIPQSRPSA